MPDTTLQTGSGGKNNDTKSKAPTEQEVKAREDENKAAAKKTAEEPDRKKVKVVVPKGRNINGRTEGQDAEIMVGFKKKLEKAWGVTLEEAKTT